MWLKCWEWNMAPPALMVRTVWLKMFATQRSSLPGLEPLSCVCSLHKSSGSASPEHWKHANLVLHEKQAVYSAATTLWAESLSLTPREGSRHPAACGDGHGEGQLHGLRRVCGCVWECHWEMPSDCSCCLVSAPILWLGRFRKALFCLHWSPATVR